MLEVDLETALAEIGAILQRVQNPTPALTAIGSAELLEAQQRIIGNKLDPDYEAWMPWARRTLKERTKKGNLDQGLLWDTGELLNSLKSIATSNSVEIGTDVPYAADLQLGTDIMPAREFLGWNVATLADHELTMTEWLEGFLA